MKASMIKKSPVHGVQVSMFNPKEHILLGTGGDEDIISKVGDAILDGYALFRFGEGESEIWYRSKDVDGMVRDVDAYVAAHGFTPKIRLYNYEPDQAVWQNNVDAWFDFAFEDESACAEFESMGATREILEEIRASMKLMRIERVGKTGQRPENVLKFIQERVRNKLWRMNNGGKR